MKPTYLVPDPIMIGRINLQLGVPKRWVCWRAELRQGRWTKPPYQTNGRAAANNDPRTWSHLDAALAALSVDRLGFTGVGITFPGSQLAALDLDDCVEGGRPNAQAMELVEEVDSYTEISPSGDGVRVLLRGRRPGNNEKKEDVYGCSKIELYCGASSGKYATVTGIHLAGTPITINDRQEQFSAIYHRLWPHETKVLSSAPDVSIAHRKPTLEEKQWLLRVMDLDPHVRVLFNGMWERRWKSHSHADASLCYRLLEMGAPPDTVQAIFRSSKLYRPDKTDRPWGDGTYLTVTIQRMRARLAESAGTEVA